MFIQSNLMGVTIIEILVDLFIPIIKLICQLSNHFLLLSFIRISHVRLSIFFKSVHEFLKCHHSIKARGFSLNAYPNLIWLLLIDLFRDSLVNLWSDFEIFGMLRESWAPKEYRIAIPSANITFLVIDLPPFMSIYNFLHSKKSRETVIIKSIDIYQWLV